MDHGLLQHRAGRIALAVLGVIGFATVVGLLVLWPGLANISGIAAPDLLDPVNEHR